MARSARARVLFLVSAFSLAGLATAGCGQQVTGEARAALGGSGNETASPSEPDVASILELDFCELLTPADFPVDAAPGDEPYRDGDEWGCGWAVSIDGAGSVFAAGVSARRFPFRQFVPPPGSPDGRTIEIAGRQTWLGNSVGPADVECGAVFGTADGSLSVSVSDGTGRGIDPCETVAGLAEIVIPRTPPPTE